MSHSHHHETENIRTAFWLNFGFTLFEIVGGIYSNSLAITSDALHDFGDSISLGMSWYLQKKSEQDRDQKYTYGYRRFSLLAALINTLILVTGSLYILSRAIPRLLHPEETNAGGMIALALAGIIVNGMAVLRVRKGNSMNAQVVAWHLLEDVLGWGAVLIVSITLIFTDLYILDPLLSVLINLYVLYNILGSLRKTLALFLQAVPDTCKIEDVEEALAKIEGVLSVHHTHLWSLDGERHVLTTHLVVASEMGKEALIRIKNDVQKITAALPLAHTTIELEFEENCSMNGVERANH